MRCVISRPKFALLCLSACVAFACASTDEVEAWPVDARLPSEPSEAQAVAPVVALPESPTLRDLLEIALERNPSVRAARERVLASAEVARIDSALPDPRILLGWHASPIETRVGPIDWSIGVRQEIPWPGKLSSRSRIGQALSTREAILYEAVVRDVIAEVVRSAHELAYLDEAVAITASIAPLLERYTAIAAEEQDRTTLRELFRAETQRAQLDNDRILLSELRTSEEEHLAALLDLPEGTPVGRPRVGALPDLDTSYALLLERARGHNQELRAAGVSEEVAAARVELARRERLPDLTVGYSQLLVGQYDSAIGAAPPNSGQDAQILYFGLSLPIWAGKNQARIRRAEALERAAHREREQTDSRLRARLSRAWFQVGNTRRLVRLYRDVLIPRATSAARTAEDLVASGKGSVAGALETIAALHNFRLAAARARADYGRSLADLEQIVGQPLVEQEGSAQ